VDKVDGGTGRGSEEGYIGLARVETNDVERGRGRGRELGLAKEDGGVCAPRRAVAGAPRHGSGGDEKPRERERERAARRYEFV
jgi:hypothetical protein